MSIPLAEAAPVAMELRELLESACTRILIAGSVRRRKAEVKDVELVAEPRTETIAGDDLWGTPATVDRLEERIGLLVEQGQLAARAVEIHRADGSIEEGQRMGGNYKALVYRGLPIDLFIVRPPADWGVIFAIRTGPGDWNQRIVTDCQKYLRRVQGGRVYHSGAYVPCPTEEDFFRAVGQPWVHPWDRHLSKVSVQARVA